MIIPVGFTRNIFDPTLLPGLTLWLDAAREVTKDSSNRVSRWADLSGFNRHAYQVTSDSVKPVWTFNSINQLPSMAFNGTNQLFHTLANQTDLFSPTGLEITVFSVLQTSTAGNLLLATSLATNGRFSIYAPYSDGTIYFDTANFSTARVNGTGNFNTYGIIRCRRKSGDQSIHKNGTLIATKSNGPPAASGATPVGIGSFDDSGDAGGFLNGFVAEIIIYKRALDGTEIGQVEKYLSAKYKIAVV